MSFKINRMHFLAVNVVFISVFLALAGCSSRVQAPHFPTAKKQTVTIKYDQGGTATSQNLSLKLDPTSDSSCQISTPSIMAGQSAQLTVTNLHDKTGNVECLLDMQQKPNTKEVGLISGGEDCTATVREKDGVISSKCNAPGQLVVGAVSATSLTINDAKDDFKIQPDVGAVNYLSVTVARPSSGALSCFAPTASPVPLSAQKIVALTFIPHPRVDYTCANQLILNDAGTSTQKLSVTASFDCNNNICKMDSSSLADIKSQWGVILNGGAKIVPTLTDLPSQTTALNLKFQLPQLTIDNKLLKNIYTSNIYDPAVIIPISQLPNACFQTSGKTLEPAQSGVFAITDQRDQSCVENITLGSGDTAKTIQMTLQAGRIFNFQNPAGAMLRHSNVSTEDPIGSLHNTQGFNSWNQHAVGEEMYQVGAQITKNGIDSTLTFNKQPLPFPLVETSSPLANPRSSADYPALQTLISNYFGNYTRPTYGYRMNTYQEIVDLHNGYDHGTGSLAQSNSVALGKAVLITAGMMELTKNNPATSTPVLGQPITIKGDNGLDLYGNIYYEEFNQFDTKDVGPKTSYYTDWLVLTDKCDVTDRCVGDSWYTDTRADTYMSASIMLVSDACNGSSQDAACKNIHSSLIYIQPQMTFEDLKNATVKGLFYEDDIVEGQSEHYAGGFDSSHENLYSGNRYKNGINGDPGSGYLTSNPQPNLNGIAYSRIPLAILYQLSKFKFDPNRPVGNDAATTIIHNTINAEKSLSSKSGSGILYALPYTASAAEVPSPPEETQSKLYNNHYNNDNLANDFDALITCNDPNSDQPCQYTLASKATDPQTQKKLTPLIDSFNEGDSNDPKIRDEAALIPGYLGGYLLSVYDHPAAEQPNIANAKAALEKEMEAIDSVSFKDKKNYYEIQGSSDGSTLSKIGPDTLLNSSQIVSFLLGELGLAVADEDSQGSTARMANINALKTQLSFIYQKDSADNFITYQEKDDLANMIILGLYVDGAFNNTAAASLGTNLTKSYTNPLVQYSDLFNWGS